MGYARYQCSHRRCAHRWQIAVKRYLLDTHLIYWWRRMHVWVKPRHIDAVRSLTCAHPDPFGRLLIAQARDERLTLLTRDAAMLELGLDGIAEGMTKIFRCRVRLRTIRRSVRKRTLLFS